MLVIDRENDRALLAKRPMRLHRLYTCLSGFTEVHFDSFKTFYFIGTQKGVLLL